MSFRIGINGFGRIGRLVVRQISASHPDLRISHVNDPALDPAQAAHLLAFDSVHGRWGHMATATENQLILNGNTCGFSREKDTAAVGWRDKADLVIDCTGRLKNAADVSQALAAGIPRLLVSQPVDGIPNIVLGVNDTSIVLADAQAVCAASCTTNCLAPVVSVLHQAFGVAGGFVTTIHGLTNDQALLDQANSDWRRGRAANESLTPTSSGFASAIGRVLPELAGRLEGYAVRAPVVNASLIDACLQLEKATDRDAVNAALAAAATGQLRHILAVEYRPLVSADYRGDTHSATVDATLTQVQGGHLLKVVAWYDNETGYSHRLVELAARLLAS